MPRKREIADMILGYLATNGPSFVAELSKKLGPRPANITENVDYLRKSGLVKQVRKYRQDDDAFGSPESVESIPEFLEPNREFIPPSQRQHILPPNKIRKIRRQMRQRKYYWLTVNGIAKALQMKEAAPDKVWYWAVNDGSVVGSFAKYFTQIMSETISEDSSNWKVTQESILASYTKWRAPQI